MLLIVALFAALFAWVGARNELRRVNIRGELQELQIQRKYALGRIDDVHEGKHWRSSLDEVDAAIAERRKRLGESNR